jgi:hypothetical protein
VSLLDNEADPNPSVDVGIKNIIIHPNFSARRKYDDIALIELKESVKFTSVLRPACLHTKDHDKDKGPLQICGMLIFSMKKFQVLILNNLLH